MDFSQFHECAEGEYDLIDLSNIVDYVNSDDYWGEVSKLYPFLSLNGIFKFGAFFYDMAPYVFMGKQARHSYQESSLDISFFLWDNDLERYKQRRALMRLDDIVTPETLYKVGKRLR